jgi:hypothetical protein
MRQSGLILAPSNYFLIQACKLAAVYLMRQLRALRLHSLQIVQQGLLRLCLVRL